MDNKTKLPGIVTNVMLAMQSIYIKRYVCPCVTLLFVPRGTNKLFVPRGQTKRDRLTHSLTDERSASYI